ncbi:MAG: tRNA lysidine(34) synthetase TilS [Deltaproteobacteria bacterium]|nr:tRNA lysidine(34) synthetase TilS [Deltaproteobacteria bacterium]
MDLGWGPGAALPRPPKRAGPLHSFELAVARTLRRRALLAPGEPVLVALSGGPDSTALLSALAALAQRGEVGPVRACHVDHGLRAGSERDAGHCRALCRALGVPFEARRVEVRAGNRQEQARRARYAALRQAAGGEALATGHTRSDQAETVILRLLRGSGARGLGAIPPRRGAPAVVRPLLDLSRSQVLAYLGDRGLGWLEDPSNAGDAYLRNRVRREILPALAALSPSAERSLARAADLLRDDDRALEARARRLVAGGAADRDGMASAPVAVQRRAVRLLWRLATGSRRGLSAARVEGVLRLLGRPGEGRVSLPGGLEARVAGGRLEVGAPLPPAEPLALPVPGPGTFSFPAANLCLRFEAPGEEGPFLREGAVSWPLWLRTRLPGDRFRPARGRGSKKLKAWLIDCKVARWRRDRLLLLADAGGRVLWIPELRVTAAGLEAGEGRRWALRLLPAPRTPACDGGGSLL